MIIGPHSTQLDRHTSLYLANTHSSLYNLRYFLQGRKLELVWCFREIANLSNVDSRWTKVVLCYDS
jgi:hypothetical protein